MSGPKLVGITCDQEVIRQNNERLQRIGKQRYYSDLFESINKDLFNTEQWIQQYGAGTISSVGDDTDETIIKKREIEELKLKFVEEIEGEKLQSNIIEFSSTGQLNRMCCDKVRAIPKWKQDFMDEIGSLLRKLQYLYEKNKAVSAKQKKQANSVLKELNDIKNNSLFNLDANDEGYKKEEIFDYSYALERKMSEKTDMEDENKINTYTLEELALIEMIENEIEEYSNMKFLALDEQDAISSINDDLVLLKSDNGIYSWNGKRNILQRIRRKYHVLSKDIAELVAQRGEANYYRKSLELEYITLCDALDRKPIEFSELSQDKMKEQIRRLRIMVEEQEQRIFVEENMTEIMKQYGYSAVSAVNLHNSDATSRIVFEGEDGRKICSAFSEGAIMMQVVGEGENPPTKEEKMRQVKEQGEFCLLYPEIKSELRKRSIYIKSEQCAPVSEESAVNVKLDKQRDIKKSTKRFSVIHRTYNNGNEFNDTYADTEVQGNERMEVE